MQTITLNNGLKMPLAGFGTCQITDPEECAGGVSPQTRPTRPLAGPSIGAGR